jgi:hypothetical protein
MEASVPAQLFCTLVFTIDFDVPPQHDVTGSMRLNGAYHAEQTGTVSSSAANKPKAASLLTNITQHAR